MPAAGVLEGLPTGDLARLDQQTEQGPVVAVVRRWLTDTHHFDLRGA